MQLKCNSANCVVTMSHRHLLSCNLLLLHLLGSVIYTKVCGDGFGCVGCCSGIVYMSLTGHYRSLCTDWCNIVWYCFSSVKRAYGHDILGIKVTMSSEWSLMSRIGHDKAYYSCRGGLHFIGYPRTERDRIVAQDLMLKGQYGAGSIVK